MKFRTLKAFNTETQSFAVGREFDEGEFVPGTLSLAQLRERKFIEPAKTEPAPKRAQT